MSYKTYALLLLTPLVLNGMQVDKKHLFIPKELGNMEVIYKKKDFSVNNTPVERHHLSKELRGISKKKLAEILLAGSYLSLKEIGEDKYKIALNSNINGGGPIEAIKGYFSRKFLASLVDLGLNLVIAAACSGTTVFVLENTVGTLLDANNTIAALAVDNIALTIPT